MLSLALKLLAKYILDLLPGSMQEVNCEDGETWTVSYIQVSVDKVWGGKKEMELTSRQISWKMSDIRDPARKKSLTSESFSEA